MNALLLTALLATAHTNVGGTVALSNGRAAGHAVVWLEGASGAKPLHGVVIDQRDRKFIPHITVVTVGTKVEFPNHDTVFHNVFTEYHSEKFDFGMYARGKSKSQVFDRPGLAVLLCSVHSEMSAYVMCVDTPYYAVANDKGDFTISKVPAGNYTLRVWDESGEKQSISDHVTGNQALTVKTKK